MNTHIYIFSREIRSGKTTELTEGIAGKSKVAGILMLDIMAKRHIYDIASDTTFLVEAQEHEDGAVAVGRFYFKEEGFRRGREIIDGALHDDNEWLIIDEVGKLEVEQKLGFEPSVTKAVAHYKQSKSDGKLLLVIRDTLLEKAKQLYQLEDVQVVTSLTDII